jgi:hypothetical protein
MLVYHSYLVIGLKNLYMADEIDSNLKTFTLTLHNSCNVSTYANIYFSLNGGKKTNMSKTMLQQSDTTFIKTYSINDMVENTIVVSGDYSGQFTINPN